jgi:enhancing lycopene biosynthesis protein 2
MVKKVAVVLSGCGVFDGAEIHESVLTLLQLEKNAAQVQAFAPNVMQAQVVNHLTGEPVDGEQRNVLLESARIMRGNIKPLNEANAENFDALIVPGGFGAAKNLSNFAFVGADIKVNPELLNFAKAMHKTGKPIGLICIAPAMTAAIFGEGARCTIGNDADTAAAIEQTGAIHETCSVDNICIDQANKLVTTPAYMLASSLSEAAAGIGKLVDQVVAMA